MKKILLCTTALVGLAGSAFAAEMSSASDMQVSIAGNSKFEFGYIKRDKAHKNDPFSFSKNQESSAFYSSNKIAVKAEGKNDMLTYGAVVRLQTVANMSNGQSEGDMNRSHIFVNSDAGAVQLGTNFAASKLMSVDAGTIASATGGITGDFGDFVDVNNDTYLASFLTTDTDTVTNRLDGRGESSRKITYLSPRISGVQLGLSYAPDMENNGGETFSRDSSRRYLGYPVAVKNLMSVALNYKNSFDDVNVMFSVAGDFGKFNKRATTEYTTTDGNTASLENIVGTANRNDVKTYSVGTVVEYQGFSAALSYANDGKSMAMKKGEAYQYVNSSNVVKSGTVKSDFKSSWYTAGLAYKNGPMSTSLTYLAGEKGYKGDGERSRTSAVSLGADYEVAAGLKPFAEVTKVEFKPKNMDEKKEKATVFILGTRVKF